MSSKSFCFGTVSLRPLFSDDQHAYLKSIVADAEGWSVEQQDKFFSDFLYGLVLTRDAGGPTPKQLHSAWETLDKACAALTQAVKGVPDEAWVMSSIRAEQAMGGRYGEIDEPESLARFLSAKAVELRRRVNRERAALPKPDKATKPKTNAQRAMASLAIEAYRDACGKLPPRVKGDVRTAWLFKLLNEASKIIEPVSGTNGRARGIGWALFLEALTDADQRK